MIIYLVGISCVGKTTIGKMLSKKIGYSFYDLDEEVEKFYQKPIERIQDESISMNSYREKASVVLDNFFSSSEDSVIAGTPSGLKYAFLKVYKKHKFTKEIVSIYIRDTHENVLNRLNFYDKDSKPIIEKLDELKRIAYLKQIKADYNYFRESFKKADLQIDIEGISLNEISDLIINELGKLTK